MRGPLLSGTLGSQATLAQVCALVREHAPVLVLSSLWLAETLASEMPVLALVEENRRASALRAKKRAGKLGLPLNLALAAADLPLAPASIGAALLDSLIDIEDENAAADLLLGLLPALQPGGMVIALDATKKPDLESRIAKIFLAASLTAIAQKRPRDGALVTVGCAPHPTVIAARLRALAR
ncbi:MAG: hypothetical protein ABSB49_13705 [Polyangia bacterium]|jgi:hypothetical protein